MQLQTAMRPGKRHDSPRHFESLNGSAYFVFPVDGVSQAVVPAVMRTKSVVRTCRRKLYIIPTVHWIAKRQLLPHERSFPASRKPTAGSVWVQCGVGPDETAVGYRHNEVSTTRRLQRGDLALLELGVVVDGFWADRSRVRAAGTPTDEPHRIFQTVYRAQQAAIGEIRPGAKACQVDEAARTLIHDAGYGDRFPHITGHGLGFRYHESTPILSPTSSEVLEEGMLTSTYRWLPPHGHRYRWIIRWNRPLLIPDNLSWNGKGELLFA